MKLLQVAEQAYRTLVEEQDDTILWLSQSMQKAGAAMDLLLAGNCAYYATVTQRQPALTLGAWQQQAPADIKRDLDQLHAQGANIYVVHADLVDRGLIGLPLHPAVKVLDDDGVAQLYEDADKVWQW
ncbi:MAG TPA: hypothetical protein VN063_06695 [Methylophilaceae bacterium]|nr:hypothetical protein [Methylophilaceae bacterium]